MRVFLDTNVWVSAVAARGVCEELLLRVLEDGLALTSPLIWEELTEVLTRKALPSPVAWQRIRSLWRSAESVEDAPTAGEDNDSRLIAAAAAAGADLFVTGDKEMLARRHSGNMRIISPRDAWLILCPSVTPQ